jgi:hypothetical protein
MNDLPAFPLFIDDAEVYRGMTLRDYFAAAALQGLIANKRHMGIDCVTMSDWAYKVANAMLKEREKKVNK